MMVLTVLYWWQLHIVAVSTRQHHIVFVWNIDLNVLESNFPKREELIFRHFPTLRESVCKIYIHVGRYAVVFSRILVPLVAEPLLFDMKER